MADTGEQVKSNGKHKLDDEDDDEVQITNKAKHMKGENGNNNNNNNNSKNVNNVNSKNKEDTVGSTTDDGNSKDYNEQSNDVSEGDDDDGGDDFGGESNDEDYKDDEDSTSQNQVDVVQNRRRPVNIGGAGVGAGVVEDDEGDDDEDEDDDDDDDDDDGVVGGVHAGEDYDDDDDDDDGVDDVEGDSGDDDDDDGVSKENKLNDSTSDDTTCPTSSLSSSSSSTKNKRKLETNKSKCDRDGDYDDEFVVLSGDSDDGESESNKKKFKSSTTQQTKIECKYGSKCYRKNPQHLLEYSHPFDDVIDLEKNAATGCNHENESERNMHDFNNYFYLTNVNGINKNLYNKKSYSVDIADILSYDDENLVKSAQFNYMFDINWLMEQYTSKNSDKPIMIVHGFNGGSEAELKHQSHIYPQIKLVRAKLDIAYGTHHTKMMLLLYKNGLKVVIHTANLIEQDWHQKTQGVWISDLFPKCDTNGEYDSKTSFKKSLMAYLQNYNDPSINEWIQTIRSHNMTTANVFVIGSCPGRFIASKHNFGHLRLRNILSNCFDIEESENKKSKIVCQFSSIGSLGANEGTWLCNEFFASLNSKKGKYEQTTKDNQKLICIYPTVENVRTSLEGYSAGGSLPYSKETAKKQPYLNNFLHEWKADVVGRSRASPHIKSYGKFSEDFKRLYWFILTSSNLSKAAWGCFEKNGTQLMVRSYELGILFLPSFILDESKTYFNVNNEFLLPYDLPPSKYQVTDRPWIVDMSYKTKADSHDRYWNMD